MTSGETARQQPLSTDLADGRLIETPPRVAYLVPDPQPAQIVDPVVP